MLIYFFFFFNDTATTEIYTLSLHDALPISVPLSSGNTAEGTISAVSLTFTSANWNTPQLVTVSGVDDFVDDGNIAYSIVDRKSTRLNSSHANISYAVFCLKKKKNIYSPTGR